MLIAVTVVSLVISQFSTAAIVAFLILLNLILGTRQELKARASVDALAKMQVPQSKVVRDGEVDSCRPSSSCPATSSSSRPATSCRPTGASCAPPPSRRRSRR